MPSQKDSYGRYGYGRHSSFRPDRDGSGIPGAKWLLVMLILAVVVLGYDRLRARKTAPPAALQEAGLQQEEAVAEAPEALAEESAPEPLAPAPAMPVHAVEAAPAPAAPAAEKPAQAEADVIVTYEMEKHAAGFVGEGAVNGKTVAVLADTGASHVVIPEPIARQIGLKKGEPMQFLTAGGPITHYATKIDKLTLGRIEIRDVAAVINPAMRNEFILLGMDVMGLLNMKIDQSKLVLQHKAAKVSEDFAVEEPFKRPVKECAGKGNKFDRQSLDCLRGGR